MPKVKKHPLKTLTVTIKESKEDGGIRANITHKNIARGDLLTFGPLAMAVIYDGMFDANSSPLLVRKTSAQGAVEAAEMIIAKMVEEFKNAQHVENKKSIDDSIDQ